MTTSEAKDITLRYLISFYGEEDGARYFEEKKDMLLKKHGLAWKLGKKSFLYFCEFFLHDYFFDYSDGNYPLSERHFEIWRELEDTILNKNNTRNCYVFPRSFGKSTTITYPLALWVGLYCIHPQIVVDSATQHLSEMLISTIKSWIEGNDYIKSAFGDVLGNKSLRNNSEMFELDVSPKRSMIRAISSTGNGRGSNYGSKRIGLLILDDAQEEKQISTDETAKTLVQRITDGLMKGLQENHNHVIAVGTVQRKGDLYDTFYHSLEWKSKKDKLIQLDDIDSYFSSNVHWCKVKEILRDKESNPYAIEDAERYYEEHKEDMQYPLIWEYYNRFDKAKSYFADPVSFKKEYQSDIDNLGEKWFKSISMISPEAIESNEFINTVLSVDPAAVTSKKSDFYAFCVMSNTDKHIKFARKTMIGKLEYNEYIDTVLDLLKSYTDINILSIERQTYMGADVAKIREKIADDNELKNRSILILNKSRSRNKDTRIGAITPDINLGGIVFNNEDLDALQQISEFAGQDYTAHDDAIDAVADAVEVLNENHVKRIQPVRVLDWRKFGI